MVKILQGIPGQGNLAERRLTPSHLPVTKGMESLPRKKERTIGDQLHFGQPGTPHRRAYTIKCYVWLPVAIVTPLQAVQMLASLSSVSILQVHHFRPGYLDFVAVSGMEDTDSSPT